VIDRLDSADDSLFLADELLDVDGVIRVTAAGEQFTELPLALTSSDNRYARIIVAIDGQLDSVQARNLDAEITAILENYPNLKPRRAGFLSLSEAVTRRITSETLTLVPLASAALLLLLSAIFRSPIFALKLLLVPSISLTIVMFGSAILGGSLGPISQLLPSFLLAVGTSYSVHVAARVLEAKSPKDVYQEVKKALSLAAGTTCAGLLSLLLLKVQGISEFALAATVGVFLCYVLSLTISYDYASVRHSSLSNVTSKRKLFSFSPAILSTPIVAVTLMVASIALLPGLLKLEFSVGLDSFRPHDSQERKSINEIEAAFSGNHFLDIVTEMKGQYVSSSSEEVPEFYLSLLEKIKIELERHSEIATVVTVGDLLQIAKKIGVTENLNLGSFVTKDNSTTRVLVETSAEGKELLALKRFIEETLKQVQANTDLEDGARVKFSLSSVELLLTEQEGTLTFGVLQSLGVTFLMIILLIYYQFRDIRVVFAGLIPNVVPVSTVFAAAGLIVGEVNVGTAVAGATALAIAADDTFHLLCTWKETKGTGSLETTTNRTVSLTFGAMLTTTIVLASVFLIVGTSEIQPVCHYGSIVGSMLIVGLLSDLVLVPFFLKRIRVKV
jgi:hypothetical protein